MKVSRRIGTTIGTAAVVFLVACGSPDEQVSPEQEATTTTTAPTTTTTAVPEPTVPPTTAAPPAAPPSAGNTQEGVVPNVVGMDHQLAQDTMQSAGFYNLSEEDASGQERQLVADRNWTVCSQSPPGGTPAPSDATIVLRSVKDGEPCP